MPYAINRYNGSELVILQDGTLDTTTSIGLLGRNYVGYGEIQNENFIYLLENFAGANPPARPLEGQSWYDSSNNRLNAFDGTNWVPVGSAIVSETSPEINVLGSLWLKTPTKQLFVYTATGWRLVGPEGVDGFGETRTQAVILRDTALNNHAVLLLVVDDKVIAICSSDAFEIYSADAIDGFTTLSQGITSSSFYGFTGNLTGNSTTATQLETGRLINGVFFNGTSNITLTANTTGTLTRGTYLTGSNFNGSSSVTWAVDASSNNVLGKVVVRDTTGSFDAGTITADQFNGPLAGNVTSISGTSTFYKIVCDNIDGFTFSGTSGAALTLSPGRRINGVLFDATQDITVPTAAENLSGATIATNVKASSLTSVGTLTSLNVATDGITIGNSNEMTISIVASTPTLSVNNGSGLKIRINDIHQGGGQADFLFLSSDQALAAGGDQRPTFVGDADDTCNIGLPTKPFSQIYADVLNGVATSAQYADLAENYQADAEYLPGTVLEFGGTFEVTLASDETRRVAGIVSTNPAYLMNSKLTGLYVVALALQGRVPCRVRGSIEKGDMLISAGDGFARKAQNPQIGTVIGKALQDFNGVEGVIEVVVGRV